MLTELGALAPGVDATSACDTLAVVSDFRFALLLRDSYGWSLDRVEASMADTSRALLLG